MSYRINSKHECPGCGLQMIQQEPEPPSPPWLIDRKLMLVSTIAAVFGVWALYALTGAFLDARERDLRLDVGERAIHRMDDQINTIEFEVEGLREMAGHRQLDLVHVEADIERIDRSLYQLRHPAMLREYEGTPILAGPRWCCVGHGLTYTCVRRYGEPRVVDNVTGGEARELTLGYISPPQGTFWRRTE